MNYLKKNKFSSIKCSQTNVILSKNTKPCLQFFSKLLGLDYSEIYHPFLHFVYPIGLIVVDSNSCNLDLKNKIIDISSSKIYLTCDNISKYYEKAKLENFLIEKYDCNICVINGPEDITLCLLSSFLTNPTNLLLCKLECSKTNIHDNIPLFITESINEYDCDYNIEFPYISEDNHATSINNLSIHANDFVTDKSSTYVEEEDTHTPGLTATNAFPKVFIHLHDDQLSSSHKHHILFPNSEPISFRNEVSQTHT